MTDEAKQNALATIFGTESLSGLLAMMNKAPGSIEAMTKDLQNCDGASQAAADAMKAGVGGAIENMQGAIETFSITVGDSLLPAIQTAAEITSTVFDQMTSGFKESGFTGAIDAAIDTLGHFADVPEPIRRITNAIDDVRDKLEAICNTKMDFSGILAPIDAVTDKLESLQSASGGGMLDGVIDLLDRLRGAISGLDGQAVPLGGIKQRCT